MSKFKKINMTINYTFASEIIELFNSENIQEELVYLTFIEYSSADEFIETLLEEAKDCFLNQEKYTFLHHFIYTYIHNYLSLERHMLIDSLCEDNELDLFISFFDKLNKMIVDSQTTDFQYEKTLLVDLCQYSRHKNSKLLC